MLGSVASNPNFGIYPLSAEESALFASLAKKTAGHIVKENQEFVDGVASRFFRRAVEEGAIIGKDGQPVKPSPEQMEAWLAEYKKGLLDHLLTKAADELQESSEKKFAEAEKKFAEAEKKFAQVAKLDQEILTKQFWSIFNGKTPVPQEKYSEIFNTYLADRSLTIEETSEGKGFGRINSMSSVIKYLQANPLTKTCDFRIFKTEVNDIPTLVDFLKTPAAFAIKGVAFKSGISDIAKVKLDEARAARASTSSPLTVRYFT